MHKRGGAQVHGNGGVGLVHGQKHNEKTSIKCFHLLVYRDVNAKKYRTRKQQNRG